MGNKEIDREKSKSLDLRHDYAFFKKSHEKKSLRNGYIFMKYDQNFEFLSISMSAP